MRSPEELQHTYPAMDGESHRGHEIFLCRKGMVEALRWISEQGALEYAGFADSRLDNIINAKLAELEDKP